MNTVPKIEKSLLEEAGIEVSKEDRAKAEEVLERKVFVSQRAAKIKALVEKHIVSIFSLQTVTITLFIIYVALTDENWFNWLEMAHFISWFAALAVITTEKDIYTASQNLLFVSLAVFVFDVLTIGFRSATIETGFVKVEKWDRQIAILVHTVFLAIISLCYVGVSLAISAKYPRREGEERELGTPSKVYNEDINRAYQRYDIENLAMFAEVGVVVIETRQMHSKEEVEIGMTATAGMYTNKHYMNDDDYRFIMSQAMAQYGLPNAGQGMSASRFHNTGYPAQNMHLPHNRALTYPYPAGKF